jgi:hypothetical protein
VSSWKPYLSNSQLNTLARCSMQYFFRYVEGIKSPPGVQLILGKGVHSSVETNLKAKMAGTALALEAVTQAAAEATRQEWAREAPLLTDDDREAGADNVLGRTIDTAVALASLHAKQVAPAIAPVAIEAGFTIELPGFPFDLVGYKDVEEADRVRDTKTTGKHPKEGSADESTQLTLYHMESAARGVAVDVQLDYLVSGARPRYVPQASKRTVDDHVRLLRRIEVYAAQIESGIFPPTDPGNWCCSAKWCGYYEKHCPWGARKAVSVGLIDPARLVSRVREERAP